jgi:sulfite exporter TauE/SafE
MSRSKNMNNLWLAFLTGLTSGGISCATVQGGLLASSISKESEKYSSTTYFILSKLVAYTILGGILGSFGSSLNLSIGLQATLQILIGLFMLATAGRILNLHPIFDFTNIRPPKFIFRLIRNSKFKDSYFSSIVLGLLTVLIPCGVTQAMLILSVGSGSFLNGALIMFFFTLGTSPVFFLLGLTIEKIFKNAVLSKFAALTVVVIGLMSLNNAQALRGSPHTFQNYVKVIFNNNSGSGDITIKNGYQEVTIIAQNNGYKTSTNTIKKGVPVKLTIDSQNVQSCARSFVIPSLNINKILPVNGKEVIEFTPSELGQLSFSCGMGMYTGSFTIVE